VNCQARNGISSSQRYGGIQPFPHSRRLGGQLVRDNLVHRYVQPNLSLDQLRAKYPPEDRDEYDRAYAAATLAGQLAELVYTLRTRAGLTQTELARRMGTTQSSIARMEGGASLPTLEMLARFAHATGTRLRLAAPGITGADLGGAA
jgi:ribosome-binding protein aMBF1 (putative translation factor)